VNSHRCSIWGFVGSQSIIKTPACYVWFIYLFDLRTTLNGGRLKQFLSAGLDRRPTCHKYSGRVLSGQNSFTKTSSEPKGKDGQRLGRAGRYLILDPEIGPRGRAPGDQERIGAQPRLIWNSPGLGPKGPALGLNQIKTGVSGAVVPGARCPGSKTRKRNNKEPGRFHSIGVRATSGVPINKLFKNGRWFNPGLGPGLN